MHGVDSEAYLDCPAHVTNFYFVPVTSFFSITTSPLVHHQPNKYEEKLADDD